MCCKRPEYILEQLKIFCRFVGFITILGNTIYG